jgi:uncharacterized protein YjbJ (UPF0337 family)
MTEHSPETVAGGPLGKVVGKLKEVAGKVTRQDDLAREGRLQQAGADAEREAEERQTVSEQAAREAELERQRREAELEREQLAAEVQELDERDRIEREAAQQRAAVEAETRQQQRAVQAETSRAQEDAERRAATAVSDHTRDAEAVERIEAAANRADGTADMLDPRETS